MRNIAGPIIDTHTPKGHAWWKNHVRAQTEHLQGVRKGASLKNTKSGSRGIAAWDIDRDLEYIEVELTQASGERTGRRVMTIWATKNVAVIN
jgi:hypothetical protein